MKDPGRRRRIIFIIISIVVVFAFFALRAALATKAAIGDLRKVSAAVNAQDLETAKTHISDAKENFEKTSASLKVFTPFRIIPLFGWYISDAQRGVDAAVSGLSAAETLVEAITPYADVLGLKGQGTFLGGTAQERLSSAVETLSKVTPQLDEVGKDLEKARVEINKIPTWRYPNIIPGRPGDKIANAKNAVNQIETFIVDARPLIEVLPQIMGQDEEKKYLILLQNDKELRPTGGFITAYAIFRVKDGAIESEGSEDIYKLDGTLLKKVAAPEPIIKYLPNVPTFNIRDSNLSPDFLTSMRQFEELYKTSSSKKEIDGIIALDTNFVLKMIEALGPIEVDGTKFTTDEVDECDCPHIIYELEKHADQPVAFEKGDRKGIIGVLMQQMMAKTFEAPKSAWPNILGTFLTSLQQKDLLLYFKDPKSQAAVEKINFAGRLYEYDGDYIHINETNFGGAKSNLYIKEDVKQVIKEGKDGNLEKKVTIEYKYPRRMDNCSLERESGLCLAGIYRDWIRVYVPKGSQLIKSTGTEVAITQTEDLGKTVFEGFFTLRPEGTGKIELEYTVPIKPKGQYKLLIQKQPGTPNHTYEVEAFGKRQRNFPLISDKELTVDI